MLPITSLGITVRIVMNGGLLDNLPSYGGGDDEGEFRRQTPITARHPVQIGFVDLAGCERS
jgi:hypothetical protein